MEDFRKFDHRRLERQARWLRELRSWRNARVAPVSDWTFQGAEGASHQLTIGQAWPSVDTPVTLRATAEVPADWAGQPVELELWLGGEGFVKLTPGYQSGLNPFHHDFRISDQAIGGERVEIEAEVVPKGMFGSHVGAPAIDRAVLTIPHSWVRALETDLRMLILTAEQLKEHEILPRLLDLVDDAYRVLAPVWPTGTKTATTRYVSGDIDGGNTYNVGLGDYAHPGFQGNLLVSGIWHIPPATDHLEPLPAEALAACDRAREVIAAGLDRLKALYPPIGKLLLTGHAHIDLAWLWPVAETRRKVRRTFSSMLRLMDQYEDFTFNQSSAQAYAWMEEDDPELLERVKVRIAEGRWEPTGGSWTEPDSQVAGGEAYVRQLFYGQRYYQQQFGIRNQAAWLPDVFGFSGGIPQLLLGAGISRFFTIKVTWSEHNAFPYDLFHWEGIDGSRVLAHTFYNPGAGYNGNIAPLDTYGTWQAFKGKRIHDESLLSFGWGDGGGGPSEDMLENYARIKEYPVLPRLEMGKVEEFFANLPTENVPIYVGELYLELHRATLTTQALVKQLNRQSEHRLVEAEAFAALAALDGASYPHEQLDKAWQSLLLNQFHDILPGSSIHEVYEDTHPELREVVRTATSVRNEAVAALIGGTSGTGAFAVTNPSLKERPLSVVLPASAGTVAIDDWALPQQPVENGVLVHAPLTPVGGLATKVLKPREGATQIDLEAETAVTASAANGGATIENNRLRVEIGADGTLHRVFDKVAHREALSDRGNQLWAYVDRPRAWDAWDIDETYEDAGEEIAGVDAIEVIEEGPLRAAVRVTRTWRNSSFVQTYRLLGQSSRLDIKTHIDWHERLMLVRALFPTSVHAHEATFETIFGVQRRPTHRNTAWERSRFEVSAHRFVDLSEPSYGVAVLNDAKYGHSAHGSTLGMSLVRGPLYPDPIADEGEHDFTYSLFPHQGDWVEAGVTQEAQALNAPLVAVEAGPATRDVPPFVSITGGDLGFGALKRAHDRDGLVLRVYEPHGDRGVSTLTFGRTIQSARRVNLLEEDIEGGELGVVNDRISLDIRPFEVVSLLIDV